MRERNRSIPMWTDVLDHYSVRLKQSAKIACPSKYEPKFMVFDSLK